MTSSSVKGIMQKRVTIPAEAVGKRVRLLIQGNGNTIDVKDKEGNVVESIVEPGTVLQKKIFNTRANSALAMQNERNRNYLKLALQLEKQGAGATGKAVIGGVEGEYTAGDLFNAYLNAVQISFGVLLPNAIAAKLSTGVEIAGTIDKITTDNGNLLTVDPTTLAVIEPESYGTASFNLDDFMEEEAPTDKKVIQQA